MKDYPRVLTVQDISCLGQCSAAVAMPILSACGCECCILPTMVLSTHTGGLGTPVRHDLTAQMAPTVAHWVQQGIAFDAIYVGYLGKAQQIQQVIGVVQQLLAPGGKLIVDPAMADHGRLYSGLDEAYAAQMGQLCDLADVMLPNVTEACMLLEQPYRESLDRSMVEQLLHRLHRRSGKAVVLTGVAEREGMTGAAVFDGQQVTFLEHKKCPGSFHGTGDMFASVLTGRLLRGDTLTEAAEKAGRFVQKSIEKTIENPAHRYGVKFETVLPLLWE